MTEKDYNAKQRENKVMKKQENNKKMEAPAVKEDAKAKNDVQTESKENTSQKVEAPQKKKEQIKRDEASVKGINLPLSTKDSVSICKFIKGKHLDKAISDLEQVHYLKMIIPMKAGFPHKKGKGVMAGKYHTKAVEYFIKLLKGLKANANVNNIEEPIITEAIPNRASMPYGRFGRVRRKRTHLEIRVTEKKAIKQSKKKGDKK